MENYQYKIQWLFTVKEGFVTKKKDLIKELHQIIKILGVRSLTYISFREQDMKIIDIYCGFISHPSGVAEVETKKYINNFLKNNPNIHYVELYRTN